MRHLPLAEAAGVWLTHGVRLPPHQGVWVQEGLHEVRLRLHRLRSSREATRLHRLWDAAAAAPPRPLLVAAVVVGAGRLLLLLVI